MCLLPRQPCALEKKPETQSVILLCQGLALYATVHLPIYAASSVLTGHSVGMERFKFGKLEPTTWKTGIIICRSQRCLF